MRIREFLKFTGLIALVLTVVVGCAAAPEREEVATKERAEQAIADAKAALSKAEEAQAAWRDTDKFIKEAETALQAGEYQKAIDLARKAQSEADMALKQKQAERDRFARAQAEQAIADAKAAYSKAEAAQAAWRDTEKMIKDAEAALQAGDYDRATDLANQARIQSELALKQRRDELARLNGTVTSYTVARGDSLWRISGKSEVYGNPYQWPLIYRANRDQIRDADLIYPGQQLRIDRDASQADIRAAIRHARTRGAWTLGVVEESDRAYLAGSR